MKLSVHLQLSLLTLVTTSASPLSLAENVSETSDTRLEGQLDALVVTGQTYRNTATKTKPN
ncbi:MAG: hypothetical protein ACTH58_03515 [Marinomonas foliarum]|uniref:hypothetical protein n=1 Tax=Marinomonas foliarum TaxID=491950 RepID=UPI003F953F3C